MAEQLDPIFWLLISAGTVCIILWFVFAVRVNMHANRKIDAIHRHDSVAAAEETRAMSRLETWEILLFVAAVIFFAVNVVRIFVTGA